MKTIKLLAVAVLFVLQLSCSCYKIYPSNGTSNEEGLRFRAPAPYVIVAQTDNGKYEAKITYLPDMDPTQLYVIKKKGFIGKADLKATLEEGWKLTQLGISTDPQIAEILSSITSLLPAVKSAIAEKGNESKELKACPAPCIYRLKYNSTTRKYELELI